MTKFLGMKKASDVKKGTRVRNKKRLKNGFVEVPEGSSGTIQYERNRDGNIDVKFDACPCCGVAASISGLRWEHLELEQAK